MNIISHLHENLNLDESKSSILEAHTVEGFLVEKYPEFKFENGTVESSNEDDVYLVASLLLFFVCVNSKDVDIKSAMCSKLSGDDQEIILKFTKSLLDCSPITLRDLQAAITGIWILFLFQFQHRPCLRFSIIITKLNNPLCLPFLC